MYGLVPNDSWVETWDRAELCWWGDGKWNSVHEVITDAKSKLTSNWPKRCSSSRLSGVSPRGTAFFPFLPYNDVTTTCLIWLTQNYVITRFVNQKRVWFGLPQIHRQEYIERNFNEMKLWYLLKFKSKNLAELRPAKFNAQHTKILMFCVKEKHEQLTIRCNKTNWLK